MAEDPSREFAPNQLVYAYHGPLIYEAKIIKSKTASDTHILNSELQQESFEQNAAKFDRAKWENSDCYLLHYQGWNAKWDEWVGTDRIMQINEESKLKKLELEQLTKKKKVKRENTSSGSSTDGKAGHGGSNNNGSNKKQKTNGTAGGSTNGAGGAAKQARKISNINLKFPPELKYALVNDWQYITKDKKLVKLPAAHPVHTILQDYKVARASKLQKHQLSILMEILHGLEIYFNKSLSLLLLYKYENLQYLEFLKNNTITLTSDEHASQSRSQSQSKVYGFEHLLRLLISFPNLIASTTMDSLSISVLISELEELLTYLKENMSTLQNEYEYTSPQYDSLARS
ncbi:uncharacterized protein LODBEIA_P34970 [Lodderomyces beijingensis]|uniref:Chromatin modification-related protein EAF3 n=1 Tax=Lodderomyces beijingensis TaxID=1775926 RepID=A0ABP0ZNM0_9ASCO